MTTLFDLLGYETQTVIKEDGNDDYEDPAYITPPLKQKSDAAIAPNESQLVGSNQDHKIFDIFSDYLETAIAMSTAETPKVAAEIRKQLIHSRVQFAFWISENFDEGKTEKIHTLMGQLTNELFHRQCELMKLRESPTAIAPQHSAIEDEIPTEKADPIPPDEPQTLKSGYVEEKTVRKNGKVVGVYLYQRWRENGKLKSKYLGSKPRTSAP